MVLEFINMCYIEAFDVVHIGFSGAFDKISHGRLIQKITKNGINGDWIQNWLNHGR